MGKDKLAWVARARDDAQPDVPEPIRAVGFLQPAGSWGAFGISKLPINGFNDAFLAEISDGRP